MVAAGDEMVVLREVMFSDVKLVVTEAVGVIVVGNVAFCVYSLVISVVVVVVVVVGGVLTVVSVDASVVVDGDVVVILAVPVTVSVLAVETLLSGTVPGDTIG